MPPTAGAVRRRIGPSRRTLFPAVSRGVRLRRTTVRLSCGAGERCGAAHRGHARLPAGRLEGDDISRSFQDQM